MLVLLFAALCLFNVVEASSCEKSYEECVQGTIEKSTLGNWFSNTYSQISNRDMCLDFFKVCKNMDF